MSRSSGIGSRRLVFEMVSGCMVMIVLEKIAWLASPVVFSQMPPAVISTLLSFRWALAPTPIPS